MKNDKTFAGILYGFSKKLFKTLKSLSIGFWVKRRPKIEPYLVVFDYCFKKLFESGQIRAIFYVVAIMSFFYSINKEVFQQNGNKHLLSIVSLQGLKSKAYELPDSAKSPTRPLNYVFVIDVSASTRSPENKSDTIITWYNKMMLGIFPKELQLKSLKNIGASISNFEIQQMRILGLLKQLGNNKQNIRIAIITVGDRSYNLYPQNSKFQFGDSINSAIKLVVEMYDPKTVNTNFISLFKLLHDECQTEKSYRSDEKSEFVLVFFSDFMHDTEKELKMQISNDKYREIEFERQKKEIDNLVKKLADRSIVTNAVLMKNAFLQKNIKSKFKYYVMETMEKYFNDFQLSEQSLDSCEAGINTNIITPRNFELYYENPYTMQAGTCAYFLPNSGKNFRIGLFSQRVTTEKFFLKYEIKNEKSDSTALYGFLRINTGSENIVLDKELIKFSYEGNSLPDMKAIRPALIVPSHNGSVVNYIIPIVFVLQLSKFYSISLAVLAIIFLVLYVYLFIKICTHQYPKAKDLSNEEKQIKKIFFNYKLFSGFCMGAVLVFIIFGLCS